MRDEEYCNCKDNGIEKIFQEETDLNLTIGNIYGFLVGKDRGNNDD
jgi:hypothetical protein